MQTDVCVVNEPRCVQRLQHGDLVVLEAVHTSTAYLVLHAEPESGSPSLLYLSSLPREEALRQAAWLEVVEQGEWIGLRSFLLGGLFLQARKRSPHLVFFSTRLGVWEQWKSEALYQGVMQQHSPALCLTSRQIPTATLSVRAWRVGTVTTPGPTPPPSSALTPAAPATGHPDLPPPPPDIAWGRNADQTPLDTVPHKPQSGPSTAQTHTRAPAPSNPPTRSTAPATNNPPTRTPAGEPPLISTTSATSSLQDDALELSRNVVRGYVARVTKWPLYLAFRVWRGEARAGRLRRAEAEAHHHRRLQTAAWAAMQQKAAGERHAQHMMVLAYQCCVRQLSRRVVGLLRRWRAVTHRSVVLRRLEGKWGRRVAQRRAAAVWASWRGCVQERRVQTQRVGLLGQRIAGRRAQVVMRHWREAAREQRISQRVLQHRRHQALLRTCITAWRALTIRLNATRQNINRAANAAAAATLHAILTAWRNITQRRQALAARAQLLSATLSRRRLATAWCVWRDAAEDAASRRHHMEVWDLIRRQQLAGRVLRRWAVAVAQSVLRRTAAERMAERRQRRRLPRAFAAWRTTAGVLTGERRRRERRADDDAAGAEGNGGHGEEAYVEGGGAQVEVERLQEVMQHVVCTARSRDVARGVLSAWRRTVARGMQLRLTAEVAVRVAQRARMRVLLRRWLGLVDEVRKVQHALLLAHRFSRLRKALHAWWRVGVAARRRRNTAALIARRSRHRQLYGIFIAWRRHHRQHLDVWTRVVHVHATALTRRALTAWRRRCAVVRSALAALARCRAAHERRLLAFTLATLSRRAARHRRLRRHQHHRAWTLTRLILRAWRRAATYRIRLGAFGRLLAVRWRWCVARSVLRSWFLTAHTLALQLHLLRLMQNASWGPGWGGGVPYGGLWAGGVAAGQQLSGGFGLGLGLGGLGSLGAVTMGSSASLSTPGLTTRQQVSNKCSNMALSAPYLPGCVVPFSTASQHHQHYYQQQYLDAAGACRLLAVSLGAVVGAEGGGRGGSGAPNVSLNLVELLLTRLPALSRWAARPRHQVLAAFRAWQLTAATRVRARVTAVRLQARRRQGLLSRCLGAWAADCADSRVRRSAAMVMARKSVVALLGAYMVAWRQQAGRLGRLRRTCLELLARRTLRRLRAVLVSWRAEVKVARSRQAAAQRVRQASRAALMRRAVGAWRGAVVAAAEMAEVAERRCVAVWKGIKRQVLSAWRQQLAISHQHAATCCRLLHARSQRLLLRQVLAGWQTCACQERQRREDWPYMCRYFYAWLHLVQPAGRAAAAAEEKLAELGPHAVRPPPPQPQPPTAATAPPLSNSKGSQTPPATILRAPACASIPPATPAAPAPAAPAADGPPFQPPPRTPAAAPIAVSAGSFSVDSGDESGMMSGSDADLYLRSRRHRRVYGWAADGSGRERYGALAAAGGASGGGSGGGVITSPGGMMWQQWFNIMQQAIAAGAAAGSGSFAIPLPPPPPLGAWGGDGTGVEATAFRARLSQLEGMMLKQMQLQVSQQQPPQPLSAGSSAPPQPAATPVAGPVPPPGATGPSTRPLGPPSVGASSPSASPSPLTASCRPEGRPLCQVQKDPAAATAAAATGAAAATAGTTESASMTAGGVQPVAAASAPTAVVSGRMGERLEARGSGGSSGPPVAVVPRQIPEQQDASAWQGQVRDGELARDPPERVQETQLPEGSKAETGGSGMEEGVQQHRGDYCWEGRPGHAPAPPMSSPPPSSPPLSGREGGGGSTGHLTSSGPPSRYRPVLKPTAATAFAASSVQHSANTTPRQRQPQYPTQYPHQPPPQPQFQPQSQQHLRPYQPQQHLHHPPSQQPHHQQQQPQQQHLDPYQHHHQQQQNQEGYLPPPQLHHPPDPLSHQQSSEPRRVCQVPTSPAHTGPHPQPTSAQSLALAGCESLSHWAVPGWSPRAAQGSGSCPELATASHAATGAAVSSGPMGGSGTAAAGTIGSGGGCMGQQQQPYAQGVSQQERLEVDKLQEQVRLRQVQEQHMWQQQQQQQEQLIRQLEEQVRAPQEHELMRQQQEQLAQQNINYALTMPQQQPASRELPAAGAGSGAGAAALPLEMLQHQLDTPSRCPLHDGDQHQLHHPHQLHQMQLPVQQPFQQHQQHQQYPQYPQYPHQLHDPQQFQHQHQLHHQQPQPSAPPLPQHLQNSPAAAAAAGGVISPVARLTPGHGHGSPAPISSVITQPGAPLLPHESPSFTSQASAPTQPVLSSQPVGSATWTGGQQHQQPLGHSGHQHQQQELGQHYQHPGQQLPAAVQHPMPQPSAPQLPSHLYPPSQVPSTSRPQQLQRPPSPPPPPPPQQAYPQQPHVTNVAHIGQDITIPLHGAAAAAAASARAPTPAVSARLAAASDPCAPAAPSLPAGTSTAIAPAGTNTPAAMAAIHHPTPLLVGPDMAQVDALIERLEAKSRSVMGSPIARQHSGAPPPQLPHTGDRTSPADAFGAFIAASAAAGGGTASGRYSGVSSCGSGGGGGGGGRPRGLRDLDIIDSLHVRATTLAAASGGLWSSGASGSGGSGSGGAPSRSWLPSPVAAIPNGAAGSVAGISLLRTSGESFGLGPDLLSSSARVSASGGTTHWQDPGGEPLMAVQEGLGRDSGSLSVDGGSVHDNDMDAALRRLEAASRHVAYAVGAPSGAAAAEERARQGAIAATAAAAEAARAEATADLTGHRRIPINPAVVAEAATAMPSAPAPTRPHHWQHQQPQQHPAPNASGGLSAPAGTSRSRPGTASGAAPSAAAAPSSSFSQMPWHNGNISSSAGRDGGLTRAGSGSGRGRGRGAGGGPAGAAAADLLATFLPGAQGLTARNNTTTNSNSNANNISSSSSRHQLPSTAPAAQPPQQQQPTGPQHNTLPQHDHHIRKPSQPSVEDSAVDAGSEHHHQQQQPQQPRRRRQPAAPSLSSTDMSYSILDEQSGGYGRSRVRAPSTGDVLEPRPVGASSLSVSLSCTSSSVLGLRQSEELAASEGTAAGRGERSREPPPATAPLSSIRVKTATRVGDDVDECARDDDAGIMPDGVCLRCASPTRSGRWALSPRSGTPTGRRDPGPMEDRSAQWEPSEEQRWQAAAAAVISRREDEGSAVSHMQREGTTSESSSGADWLRRRGGQGEPTGTASRASLDSREPSAFGSGRAQGSGSGGGGSCGGSGGDGSGFGGGSGSGGSGGGLAGSTHDGGSGGESRSGGGRRSSQSEPTGSGPTQPPLRQPLRNADDAGAGGYSSHQMESQPCIRCAAAAAAATAVVPRMDVVVGDPISCLAELAQRRGQHHLAATLERLGLAGDELPRGVGAMGAASAAMLAAAAAETAIACLRGIGPIPPPRGTYDQHVAPTRPPSPPLGLTSGSGSGAGAGMRVGPGPRLESRAATEAPSSRGGGGGAAGGGIHMHTTAMEEPRQFRSPPPQRPHRPDMHSSLTASGSSTATSGSGITCRQLVSRRTRAHSDGGSTSTLSSASSAEGKCPFELDPLHSPIRRMLAECRALDSKAAERQAHGNAVVREVVSGLSPRRAVAVALQAVMAGGSKSRQAPTGGVRTGGVRATGHKSKPGRRV